MPLTTTPAADGFRMPGEFEPHSGTWLLWPERTSNWRCGAKPAQAAFAAVATAIATGEPVTVGVSRAQFVHARSMLPDAIRVVEMSSDDSWMRDVGPTFVIDGKGIVGAYVEADHEGSPGVPEGIPVADHIRRVTVTDADGRFTFRPLPPGPYRVCPRDEGYDPSLTYGRGQRPGPRPLPAVFVAQKVELRQDTEPKVLLDWTNVGADHALPSYVTWLPLRFTARQNVVEAQDTPENCWVPSSVEPDDQAEPS